VTKISILKTLKKKISAKRGSAPRKVSSRKCIQGEVPKSPSGKLRSHGQIKNNKLLGSKERKKTGGSAGININTR